jgi:dienelactone hydrolase
LFTASLTAAAGDHPSAKGTLDVGKMLERATPSREEWEWRRAEVRRWLTDRLGRLPRPGRAALRKIDEGREEGFQVESFQWQEARQGNAWCVLMPLSHLGRGPAVVYFPGLTRPAAKNARFRSPGDKLVLPPDAVQLVQAGYIVLVASHDDEQRPDQQTDELAWRKTLAEDIAACQHLMDRRDVDPERVAVWGVEAGARRAWFAAALDQRIAAVVTFADDEKLNAPTTKDTRTENRALLSLIAPRPHHLWLARPAKSASDLFTFTSHIYEAYELSTLFRPTHTDESRASQQALSWLKDEL